MLTTWGVYLGYSIHKDGLHTMPEKITAILEAPKPENVRELRSFLGLVNYYGCFIQNLSTITHPMKQLLHRDTGWVWNKACNQAFNKLKAKLASHEVLAHYDPQLLIKLDCDASAYGVGAVLSHQYSNGQERPIAYASRTLSSAEKTILRLRKKGWL